MSSWISDRMQLIDASGIRKVFDLAAKMKNPINLSIGQPHFDTPAPLKQALFRAVEAGRTLTARLRASLRSSRRFSPQSTGNSGTPIARPSSPVALAAG